MGVWGIYNMFMRDGICDSFRGVSCSRGFTMIEALVVLGILTLLAGVVLGVFPAYRRSVNLNTAVETGAVFLAKARSRTLGSEGATRHGVHFESDRMVLFRGAAYNALDPANETTMLPSGIEISVIALNGGGVDVVFDRLTGGTNGFGTVTFRSLADPLKTKVLTILNTGSVSAVFPEKVFSVALVASAASS